MACSGETVAAYIIVQCSHTSKYGIYSRIPASIQVSTDGVYALFVALRGDYRCRYGRNFHSAAD